MKFFSRRKKEYHFDYPVNRYFTVEEGNLSGPFDLPLPEIGEDADVVTEADLILGEPDNDTDTNVVDHPAIALAVMNIFETASNIDDALMSPIEKERLAQLKRWTFRIAHKHIGDQMQIDFPKKKEDPPQV
jgi:hypothetical protein